MKLKIYVKRFKNENGEPIVAFPKVISKGDWVDLYAAKECVLNAPQASSLLK